MKPALTAEEWERYSKHPISWEYDMEPEWLDNPQGLAALCLHGQPFGFTREDVATLRQLGRWQFNSQTGMTSGGKWLHDLADRIEALLPPEDS